MNNSIAKSKIIAVVLLTGVLPLLVSLAAYFLIGDAKHIDELLHACFELVGSCIAISVAMLLLLRLRQEEKSSHLLWVVAALVTMGLVDGLHGVHGISLWSWQRHGATLIGGVLFGLVWLPMPPAVIRRKGLFVIIVAGVALALGFWWGSEGMPVTWDPVGLYTLPVKAANALGGLGFLAAAFFFCRRFLRQSHSEDLVFASLTVLFGMSSLFFGLSHTWAADWWVWHGFRLLAYAIVLVAAYGMVITLYRRISGYAQELEGRVQERTEELATANAVLRDSEERYRTTMMSVGDGVMTTDTEGRLELLNPVAETLTGWRQEEARGKPLEEFFRIINEETRQIVENPVRKVMREGMVVGLANHSVLIAKDGTEHPIADSGAPIRNEKGEITGVVLVFRDQTEERAALKALRESERKFRETVTHLDEGYYSCMMDGVLLEHNQAFNRILGFDIIRDLKGEKLPDFWQNPDERKVYLQELMTRGSIMNYLINAKTISGEKVVVMANSHLVKDEKGGLVRIEGTFSDFTERKRAEEQIKDSEKRFRELIESLPQLFWTCKVDGPCDYLSKQWVEYTGIPEAEQLGYRWLEQLHPEDKDRTVSEWMEKVKTGDSFDVEFRIRRNDGVYHWFKTRAVPMRDTERHIVKWFGSNTDFDEIKKAEEQLRNSSKELEKKVDERTKELHSSKQLLDETGRLARVGGWELDLKKNVLSFSDVTKQIHEVDPEYQPTLEVAINFYAPEAVPVISEAVRRAIEDGESYDVELQLITAKQNRIWVRAIGQAYRENGEIVRIGGVFQDINERKLAEQEREALMLQIEHRSSLLEATNKELEAFTYSVSHDLRAPLRHMSGYVELLTSRFQSALTDKGKHYLNSIADSVHQMGKLIDNLLQYSRTGRAEMRRTELEMNAIVRETVESVHKDNPGRTIEWVVGKLPSVYGDDTTLRLVWMNLLSNAVKFTRTREKALIEIGAKAETKEVTYFVRDNGVGFDMQYAQKLFGVFQRLHSTEEFEGTGIGLANVHRIVVRHGGRAWAEAELNKGATFYFSIPKQ